jgi:hypothetical protein
MQRLILIIASTIMTLLMFTNADAGQYYCPQLVTCTEAGRPQSCTAGFTQFTYVEGYIVKGTYKPSRASYVKEGVSTHATCDYVGIGQGGYLSLTATTLIPDKSVPGSWTWSSDTRARCPAGTPTNCPFTGKEV